MLAAELFTRNLPMDDTRFADVMRPERERLNHEREETLDHQKELENKLTEITRELEPASHYHLLDEALIGAIRSAHDTRENGAISSEV